MLKKSEDKSPDRNVAPIYCAVIAEGFGLKGFKVEDPDDLKPILQTALYLGKPAVADVDIHPGEF